jgi:hypothetical protein
VLDAFQREGLVDAAVIGEVAPGTPGLTLRN